MRESGGISMSAPQQLNKGGFKRPIHLHFGQERPLSKLPVCYRFVADARTAPGRVDAPHSSDELDHRRVPLRVSQAAASSSISAEAARRAGRGGAEVNHFVLPNVGWPPEDVAR